VAVEGRGLAVDNKRWIALGNEAVFVSLHGANATIALPCNGTIHDFSPFAATHDFSAVAVRVSDADDPSHAASVIA
jgi:hypothetical protein